MPNTLQSLQTEVRKPEPEIISLEAYRLRYHELWRVCETCNFDNHRCPACGDDLRHNSIESRRIYNHYRQRWEILLTPHWLSDCRPDLMDGTYDGTTTTDGRLG